MMRETRMELIDELNRLMAEEAEASLRYFQMRFRLRGRNRVTATKFFEDALKETLEHAEALAQHIQAMGHVPTLRINLTLGGEPIRPEDALAEALEVEQQALDAYKDFLPRVAGDSNLEAFIQKQVTIEAEHVDDIRRILRAKRSLKLVAPPKAARRARA